MSRFDYTLPPGCELRRAERGDRWKLLKLVLLTGRIEPAGWRWRRFWVVECDGDIVACGQLRESRRVQELGSVVVDPAWRDRDLGRALFRHLLSAATKPLYFHTFLALPFADIKKKHGAKVVAANDAPIPLRWKFKIAESVSRFFPSKRGRHMILRWDPLSRPPSA